MRIPFLLKVPEQEEQERQIDQAKEEVHQKEEQRDRDIPSAGQGYVGNLLPSVVTSIECHPFFRCT